MLVHLKMLGLSILSRKVYYTWLYYTDFGWSPNSCIQRLNFSLKTFVLVAIQQWHRPLQSVWEQFIVLQTNDITFSKSHGAVFHFKAQAIQQMPAHTQTDTPDGCAYNFIGSPVSEVTRPLLISHLPHFSHLSASLHFRTSPFQLSTLCPPCSFAAVNPVVMSSERLCMH